MHKLKQINLLDLLDIYGEHYCQKILSSFICPKNLDVTDFLHNKAIHFTKQKIAITFLIFQDTPKGSVLIGYYTLANKFLSISADILSKTFQKRISKFSQYDTTLNRYLISMPLIAQLGKNFSDTAKNLSIDGSTLLKLACQTVTEVQRIIGGKTVYIECASSQKLFDFYSQNDFYPFGKRHKENSELSESPILIQMLHYFKD